jgi:hypothetical protein
MAQSNENKGERGKGSRAAQRRGEKEGRRKHLWWLRVADPRHPRGRKRLRACGAMQEASEQGIRAGNGLACTGCGKNGGGAEGGGGWKVRGKGGREGGSSYGLAYPLVADSVGLTNSCGRRAHRSGSAARAPWPLLASSMHSAEPRFPPSPITLPASWGHYTLSDRQGHWHRSAKGPNSYASRLPRARTAELGCTRSCA